MDDTLYFDSNILNRSLLAHSSLPSKNAHCDSVQKCYHHLSINISGNRGNWLIVHSSDSVLLGWVWWKCPIILLFNVQLHRISGRKIVSLGTTVPSTICLYALSPCLTDCVYEIVVSCRNGCLVAISYHNCRCPIQHPITGRFPLASQLVQRELGLQEGKS